MPLLEYLEESLISHYKACELCPRRCGVDRTASQLGFCGEGTHLHIATIEAHLGEEPPISGKNGSGTVFFSGCSLRCLLCQNYQISQEGLGREWTLQEVVDRLAALHEHEGIHNVNFVTPDHFLPHTVAVIRRLRERGIRIPTVYNLSGYQRVESLRMIEPIADIYLPDFKYADPALARRFSQSADYATVALEALSEMVCQKGFLDTFVREDDNEIVSTNDLSPPSREGVLARHLILPGQVQNSLQVLSMLFVEFGRELPISLMSQYVPVRQLPLDSPLNRQVTRDEFQEVFQHAQELGFRNLFVQYPGKVAGDTKPFLPDFSAVNPFPGNMRT
ncbi:MAG: radical SAM protein [Desulfobacterales bacterium]|nr:radical SAM protein [Desulfobacterales bacterium]